MTQPIFTVSQAARQLKLHPKTVLRYIREGRLEATRIGKAYRIAAGALDAFAGIAVGASLQEDRARTTCIVDFPDMSATSAQRMETILHAAAMAGDAGTPRLHLQTAYNPFDKTLKIVMIGSTGDIRKLLEMVELQEQAGS